MRGFKIVLCIAVLAGVFIFSGCQKSASQEVDPGTYQGSVYTNNYFGMTVTMPDNWSIQDEKAMEMIMGMGRKAAASGDKGFERELEMSESLSANIFAVFKHPLGTPVPFNPNLLCLAEQVRHAPGIKRGSDYHYQSRKNIERTQVNIKVTGEIYPVTLGGVEFDVMPSEVKLQGMRIQQRAYATIRKGYALLFIMSFIEEAQAKELEQILDTVTFK
jgi:hypothetical protein